MANVIIPPKTVRVLFALNSLNGKSGIANILYNYKKFFPNDYMNYPLLVANLKYQHKRQRVVRTHNSYRDKFRGDNPQTYTITSQGDYQLRKWKLI